MDDRDPAAPPTDAALYDDGKLAIIAGRYVICFLAMLFQN
jgi:hypothetical protein